MKNAVNLPVLLLALGLFSCKPFQFSELKPGSPLQNPLPALEPVLLGAAPTPYGPPLPPPVFQDLNVVYEREVKSNLTRAGGDRYGYAVCRVIAERHRPGALWLVSSAVLLFTPNLLGYPAGQSRRWMEVEVEVFDAQRRSLGRYSGYGQAAVPVAAYWGYAPDDAARASSVRAFKAALADIKTQMDRDADRLNAGLRAGGPV